MNSSVRTAVVAGSCFFATLGVQERVGAGEINLPSGLALDVMLDQIDGTTPRLEVVRTPAYGSGVLAASVDQGILTVLRVTTGGIEVLATKTGFDPDSANVLTIRFDRSGQFANELYLAVSEPVEPVGRRTTVLRVQPDGLVDDVATIGGSDFVSSSFDFPLAGANYAPGAYLQDGNITNGTSFHFMDTDFSVTQVAQNLLPPGRTDIDNQGMEFDPTGLYNGYLTIADSDDHDQLTVLYQLKPDLETWSELSAPVSLATREYGDLAFSPGGTFSELLFVTDKVTDTVMKVAANGGHGDYITGFEGIESITIDDTGDNMYVSDANGVYRIREENIEPGPTIVMREPWVKADDLHTGPSGVDALRLLFSERILFDSSDVSITNENGDPITVSASGSNSAFMILTFGDVLVNDVYAITIGDSVISADTGLSIDGDNDGAAGGSAILTLEHRSPFDADRDSDVDLLDYADFGNAFTGTIVP